MYMNYVYVFIFFRWRVLYINYNGILFLIMVNFDGVFVNFGFKLGVVVN